MQKKTILLIGPYSSIGGVSEHIKRLAELLKKKYTFLFIDESPLSESNNNIYNVRKKNLLKYLNLINKADIVHIHTGVWWLRLMHILVGKLFFKKVVVTIHSLTNLKNGIPLFLTNQIMHLNSQTIFVNDIIRNKFKSLRDTFVIPAFIPPIDKKEVKLPSELLTIINNTNDKIIVANAYRIILNDGVDLYGIDLALDLAKLFKNNNKNFTIVFIIASLLENRVIFDKYKAFIKKEKLEKYIILYTKPINFISLIKLSDLVIRPTNSDGDALTIREAIFLNKPVIASDIVKRPSGTITFMNRNVKDLYSKINEVLNTDTKQNTIRQNINYEDIYLKVYNNI